MPASIDAAARPAKIGLVCFPSTGHTNPMAALGCALQRRGHSVHFIHVLDMQAAVEAAGLSFIPIGASKQPLGALRKLDDEMRVLQGKALMDFGIRRMINITRMELDELPDILRQASPPFDLLLLDSFLKAPFAVAQHCGVPAVTVDVFAGTWNEDSAPPVTFDWQYGTPESDGGVTRQRNAAGNQLQMLVGGSIKQVVDAQRKQWGMKEVDNNEQCSDLLRICQMPAFVNFPRSQWPPNHHHTGPWTEPSARPKSDFPYERLNGAPLVYASLGMLTNGYASIYQTIAAAFSTLDVQLVLDAGGGLSPSALGELPGDPLVVARAPQLDLIQQASLVITHCGTNTSLETLSAGKPMVCIPQFMDQPGNARRLERLGVCEIVRPKDLTAETLRAAAEKVLGDASYRQKAEEAAARIKELDGLAMAVRLIEGVIPIPTSDGAVANTK